MVDNFITANDLITKVLEEQGSTIDSFNVNYYYALEKISDFIETYRQDNRLSQADLSKKLKVSQSMVAKYESGEYNFSLKVLMKTLFRIGYKIIFKFVPIVDKSECAGFVDVGGKVDSENSTSRVVMPSEEANLSDFSEMEEEEKAA